MKHQGLIMFAVLTLSAFQTSACIYRPARFADQEAVTKAQDDRPIPLPQSHIFLPELFQADTYVRRELVKGLDPRRYPQPGDINSLDEVVHSSWFRADEPTTNPLANYAKSGPPQPPFQNIDEAPASGYEEAMVFEDRRGLRYERINNTGERPGMRSGAAAIASRLVHAIGYRTPPVWIVRDEEGERFAAMRWPLGIDLGPTSTKNRRDDDANDQLDHVDRRSLRSLALLAAWLDIGRIEPRMLRDVYVGKPGKGHIQHYVVGLDLALGVGNYESAVHFARDPDRERKNFFLRMFSMGLSPKPPPYLPKTRWPHVGLISERVSPKSYDPSPPFEPFDRRNAADDYWFAKQLTRLSRAVIADAVQAAGLSPVEQNWLFQVLLLRRDQVVAKAMKGVTPCEALGLETKEGSHTLLLRDLTQKPARSQAVSYRVELLNGEGDQLHTSTTTTHDSDFALPLSTSALSHGYLVMRIWRQGRERPAEIHIIHDAKGTRIRGIRH